MYEIGLDVADAGMRTAGRRCRCRIVIILVSVTAIIITAKRIIIVRYNVNNPHDETNGQGGLVNGIDGTFRISVSIERGHDESDGTFQRRQRLFGSVMKVRCEARVCI